MQVGLPSLVKNCDRQNGDAKEGHAPIPSTCDHVTLHGKENVHR